MRAFGRFVASLGVVLFLALSLAGPVLAAPSARPDASDPDPIASLTGMPAIGVAVLHDGVDPSGRWAQVVQITIESGGSLADASQVVYGDAGHVDALFAAAQKTHPHLTAPAMVPAGLQIDLTIDPSTTFVVQAILHGSNTVVHRYTNGVVSTTYTKPEGSLSRVVTFPEQTPTDLFVYPAASGPIKVRPGGKIVDLIYAAGETFGDVVGQAYGITNFNAASDLTKQTGWSQAKWPPKPGTEKLIVTQPVAVYAQEPKAIAPIPNPDPVGEAREEQQLAARRQVGVYPVRLDSFGTLYHVEISDPKLTASDLSTLIYGSPAHTADVARAAGVQVSGASFDPHLFGRAFDLSVDYVDEDFVLWRRATNDGTIKTGLVDGAVITTYPPSKSGPLQVVEYPSGYKRIVYQPPGTLVTIARGLALFNLATVPSLSGADASAREQKYVADMIWRWGPGLPRSSDDIADNIQLVQNSAGTFVSVLVAPPAPRSILAGLVDALTFRNPFAVTAGLLFVGCAAAIAVAIAQRSAARARRIRW